MTDRLTDADLETLGDLATGGEDPRSSPALTDPVDEPPARDRERKRLSKSLCDAINEYVDAGHGAPETAAHFGLARTTVERHADAYDFRGPCKQHTGLDRPACGYLREAARGGKRRAALAEQFDVDPATVTYHVRGRCACGTGVPPAEFQG